MYQILLEECFGSGDYLFLEVVLDDSLELFKVVVKLVVY